MAVTDAERRQELEQIDREIEAYESLKEELEASHLREWVVIRKGKLINTYEDFQDAAADAVRRFGRGPYLIRQVGAGPVALPVSVLYRPVYADG